MRQSEDHDDLFAQNIEDENQEASVSSDGTPSNLPVQFDRTFRISDAARFLGVSPQSLRDYENLGVVSPEKSYGGTRTYGFNDLSTLESLRLWRHMGMSLQEATKLTGDVDTAEVSRGLALCHDRYELMAAQANQVALRLEKINARLAEAPPEGIITKREQMEPMIILGLVQRGAPVEDPRLENLAAAWLEHVPCVFYVNAYEDLNDAQSTFAGLGIHITDVVGWDPYEGADGLCRYIEGKHSVHGYGWSHPGDDAWHDIELLKNAAPRKRWGQPKGFFAESLLATNTPEGQRIFWSQWLLF